MDRFKIEQVATQIGVTKRTIRYYEEIGILPPSLRSNGGIRYYTQEHIDILRKIRNAKDALGFTLQELQYFISLDKIIEAQKVSYKQLSEPIKQKENLIEVINNLDKELKLIEQKIQKINGVRNDLLDLKNRAQELIEKINLKYKQD